jgi:hypothetical protein
MCDARAFEKPMDETSSFDGDWECEWCGFRWKKHGQILYYVGLGGGYLTWISVPEGLMPVFDDGTRSVAWHKGKSV